jgi:chitosanase
MKKKQKLIVTTVALILVIGSSSVYAASNKGKGLSWWEKVIPFFSTEKPAPNNFTPMKTAAKTESFSAEQKRRAEQLTNLFENGTTEFQYGYVENLNDGRGYTCGRVGFTTGTGDAYVVVKRYTDRVPHNPLAKFLPELERLNSLPEDSEERADVSGLKGFPEAWESLGNDKVFRAVQDEVVDELYYQPAMKRANQVGIQTALGKAIFYDTIIQHGDGDDPDGLPALIEETTKKMGGTPKTGIDEEKWLSVFLDVRRADLAHAHNPATREEWEKSVGRVDSLKQLVKSGNFDLHGPFTIEWENEYYTIP